MRAGRLAVLAAIVGALALASGCVMIKVDREGPEKEGKMGMRGMGMEREMKGGHGEGEWREDMDERAKCERDEKALCPGCWEHMEHMKSCMCPACRAHMDNMMQMHKEMMEKMGKMDGMGKMDHMKGMQKPEGENPPMMMAPPKGDAPEAPAPPPAEK